MPETDRALAARLEAHEARIWASCVRSTAESLRPVVGEAGGLPVCALTALDDDGFNRVVGLGTCGGASEEQVAELVAFYRKLGSDRFRVELAPFAAPRAVVGWLRAAGMEPGTETYTKKWRDVRTVEDPVDPADVDVRILGPGDAERVGALSVRAWGAWKSPVSLSPWFSSTVGRHGLTHYGAFVDGVLRTVGAMAVEGDLAWVGFDACHPRFRGRGLRHALTTRRFDDARRAGVRFVHAEARTSFYSGRYNLLDQGYERVLWRPASA